MTVQLLFGTSDGMIGSGLDETVLHAYLNIFSNYQKGDKLYIFGFSRGAVSARYLCNFINTADILKPDSAWRIEEAWRFFIEIADTPDEEYNRRRQEFRIKNSEYCNFDAQVEFVGLWDAVCGPYNFNQLVARIHCRRTAELEMKAKTGVHIVPFDDLRSFMTPFLWTGYNTQQNLHQIWMPGVHADIGGGYSQKFLSNASILLMLDLVKRYCSELTPYFDNAFIEGDLLEPMRKDEIAINNEFEDWKWKLTPRRNRKLDNLHDGFNKQHPMTNLIRSRPIRIRKAISLYEPSLRMKSLKTNLQDIALEPDSFSSRVADIVAERCR
jgi:hypothetical protein